jgi:hypothetical protein
MLLPPAHNPTQLLHSIGLTFGPELAVSFELHRERDVVQHVDGTPNSSDYESGFAFSSASCSLMNARISSTIVNSLVHCSL